MLSIEHEFLFPEIETPKSLPAVAMLIFPQSFQPFSALAS